MNSIEEILIQQQRRASYFGSDFTAADCLAEWTTVEGDANGDVALATGANLVGGQITLVVTTTNNEECYIHSQEIFDFGPGGLAGKSIVAECRLKYTEIATDDASVMFGLMSAVAANSITDTTGEPQATYSGAVIYKVDGGTVWKAEASVNGTTKYGTATSTQGSGGGVWQTLRIETHPLTATRCDVSFLIDPNGGSNFIPLKDSNLNPLKYEMDITTTTEMSLFAGLKNGGANSETVYIDYMHAVQIR